MKTLKRNLILVLNIGVLLSFLVVSIGFVIKNDGSEKSIAELNQELLAYRSANAEIAELVTGHTEAISLLNEEISATKQYAEDWEAYVETLSAQVIYVPEYHEQTTVQEVEVEKPVYVNNQWREFESPAVLMSWADEHLANLWIVGDQVADCDDYAYRLQYEAYKDGYLLSVQIIKDGMLNGKNVSNYLQLHMGNLAMIGNEIYFIEPQPKYFRIVFVCNRD